VCPPLTPGNHRQGWTYQVQPSTPPSWTPSSTGKRIPAHSPTRPHLQHGDLYLHCSSPAAQVPCLTSLAWSVCTGAAMCRSRAVQKPQFQCSVEKCCQLSHFIICDYWWFELYEMKCCCPTLELSCFFGLYSEYMNYNYQFLTFDWPLASSLADDVLEITGAYMC